jgi:probable rRNA maturation factor
MKKNSKNPHYNIIINQEFTEWQKVSFDLTVETRAILSKIFTKFLASLPYIEISIILADNSALHSLNKAYRHQDKATNVLSFGYGEQAFKKGILGDLFLAFETIAYEAQEQEKTFHDHYIHLIIHGTLHLLGYDHEDIKDAQLMEELEVKILESLNIANPYVIQTKRGNRDTPCN